MYNSILFFHYTPAPPDISVERTWIHAAEGCDIQLACTLNGDVNSEVSTPNSARRRFVIHTHLSRISLLTDDVVPKLVPFGSHGSSHHVRERREVHFEHHELSQFRLWKLQVRAKIIASAIQPSVDRLDKNSSSPTQPIYFATENSGKFRIHALMIDLIICCLKANLNNVIN